MKVSIICCYFNEIHLIKKKLINSILKINNVIKPEEIILIDNCSTDGTTEFLKEKILGKIKNVKIIFNENNLGKGGSIKKAAKVAKGDILGIFDIDEYEIDDLKTCINKIFKSYDLIIGSRLLEKKPDFLYKKNLYGVMLITKIINILFKLNLTDAAGATKIFKKKIYDNLIINSSGFDFEFELICKFAKLDFNVAESPSNYKPRSYSDGKKLRAFRDGFKIFLAIIKCYLTPNRQVLKKTN